MKEEYRLYGSATVELYIYDLSKGTAAKVSPTIFGRKFDGIWHTAIVVYGNEYYFGSTGIECARPGCTDFGKPEKVQNLGETWLSYSFFLKFINGLRISRFAPDTYNFLKHNCNSFTEKVSNFLVGTGIPKYILDLPKEILQTPIGRVFAKLTEKLSTVVGTATIKRILGLLEKMWQIFRSILGAIELAALANILMRVMPISM